MDLSRWRIAVYVFPVRIRGERNVPLRRIAIACGKLISPYT